LRLREAKEWIEGGIHKCLEAIAVYLRLGEDVHQSQGLSLVNWGTIALCNPISAQLGKPCSRDFCGGSKKRRERIQVEDLAGSYQVVRSKTNYTGSGASVTTRRKIQGKPKNLLLDRSP